MIVKYTRGVCKYEANSFRDTYIREIETRTVYPIVATNSMTVIEALECGKLELVGAKLESRVSKKREEKLDIVNDYYIIKKEELTKQEQKAIQTIVNKVIEWKKREGLPLLSKEQLIKDLTKGAYKKAKKLDDIQREFNAFYQEELW